MIIGEHLQDYQSIQPSKPAIITENQMITYEQFVYNIMKIQKYLTKHFGNQPKLRIALQFKNEPAFPEVFFAAVMLGHSCVPLDPKWNGNELNSALESSKPDLLVTHKIYDEMMKVEPRKLMYEAVPTDIFYIGFTSGSTGKPKGFLRHHTSWIDSFEGCSKAFELTNEEVYCAPGPLCHSLSLFAAVYALHIGATLVLPDKFEPKAVQNIIKNTSVTTLFVVPTMLQAMVDDEVGTLPKVKNILSSGAKWSSELKEKIGFIFSNANRTEFYGASETSFITYQDERGFRKRPTSVGKAFPGVDITIKDTNGNALAPNEIGQVHIKSSMLYSGYLHQPQIKQVDELSVGDLGFMDEEGYLILVGREKNMIISGGLNIYPEEIEGYLKKIEDVEEVVVTGIADDYWGERVVALIKWKLGSSHTDSYLKECCKQGLAAHKCPKEFYSVEDFPYTSSGKVARKETLNLYSSILGSEKK
ncbi:AMP-binding protein [Bacillus sp. DJP31]|uniref:AMP-binding protein n=1 Tax=Bacillus sp. DJP31 TaxID=3409789 RepID=UPI003BB7C5AF